MHRAARPAVLTPRSPLGADPLFNYIGVLLHFDGANGSTTVVDSGPSKRTGISVGLTNSISTSESVFGGSSWRNGASNSYVQIPATNIAAPGSTPWSFEARLRFDNFAAARVIFDTNNASTNNTGMQIFVGTDGKLYVYSGTQAVSYGGLGAAMAAGTFNAIQVNWDGTLLRFFVGGSLLGTASGFDNTWGNRFVLFNSSFFTQGLISYADEVRYTYGRVRNLESYAPLTGQFPDY